MRAKQLTAGLLGVALLVLGTGVARAEPYLAVRTGAKCSDCHTNLDGGGKRTSFATSTRTTSCTTCRSCRCRRACESFNGELNQ